MMLGEMIGKIYVSREVEDRIFFNIIIPTNLTHNYTVVEFDKYLFLQGEGWQNDVKRSDEMHISTFQHLILYRKKNITIK